MKKRIIIFYLLMTLLVSGVGSVLSYYNAEKLYLREAVNRLSDATAILGSTYLQNAGESSFSIDAFAKKSSALLPQDSTGGIDASNAIRVTIVSVSGEVLGDSAVGYLEMENHLNRTEIADAILNGTGSSKRLSPTMGIDYLYFARYLDDQQIVIRLALPLTKIDLIRKDILLVTFSSLAIGLALSVILSISLVKWISSPVAKLTRETGKMLKGNLNQDLETPASDDLSGLTRNFNEMAQQLEATIKSLEQRNASVDTIISSMHNGMLAVDADMHVVMINPVVYDLMGTPNRGDVIGKPLVAVFRNNILYETMERSMKERIETHGEIILYERGKRILDVQASPIETKGDAENRGSLVFLSDVTTVRRLEEMRSAFVSNVTHELKTPLTSIRGFVETLRGGAVHDEKVADRFMEIIDIEVDRLSRLIDDILELSDIENSRREADMARFDLRQLMQEVAEILQHQADLKEVVLIVNTEEPVFVYAGRHRIKQLLINLVDNGIKYNRIGGSVRMEAMKRAGKLQITVSDTGIGIPNEHQARIFERFYRVDKGRSREQGGTGLGLSIVKHIAQIYNGTVTVKSESGQGTVFTVNLTI